MLITMKDECITSSPSERNKSVRETRLKRIKKRKTFDQHAQSSSVCDQNATDLHNIINEFYKDSDESVDADLKTKCSMPKHSTAVVKNFTPFLLEKSLVMADHVLEPQVKQNQNDSLEIQGFVTCSNLNDAGLEAETEHKKSSFIITESELLSCCHRAEKILKDATFTEYCSDHKSMQQLTPKNNSMMLVNSILEDFSQSPLGEGQIITNTSWQYTPEFRLRRPPAKCYSRKFLKITKTNLNQRFERNSTEYSDDHSSCSSLSVQENILLGDSNLSTVTNPDNTQRLCENLLNLTEYFAQNLPKRSSSDEQQRQYAKYSSDRSLDNIPVLINDIVTLRARYHDNKRYDSFNSIDDFYGFSGTECKSNEDHEDKYIMSKNINSKSNYNILMDTRDNWTEGDDPEIFACINTENILEQNITERANKTPPKSIPNLNIPAISFSYPDPSSCIGFKTASSKAIKVSKEAQIIAAKILSQLPEITALDDNISLDNCDKKTKTKDDNIFENSEDDDWNDDCDLFLNFQTPIPLSQVYAGRQKQLKDDLKEQEMPTTSKLAACKLKGSNGELLTIQEDDQNGVQETFHKFLRSLDNNKEPQSYEKTVLQVSVGGKNVQTSVKAEENVEKLLRDIEEDPKLNFVNDLSLLKNNLNEKNFVCTANKLSKADSNKKKLFLDLPNEAFNISNKNLGFQTANGKKVFVSENAKRTIEKLLQEVSTASSNIENFESELKDIKTSIQNKNKTITATSVIENNEHTITSIKACATSPNFMQATLEGKRKFSMDSDFALDSAENVPASKMFKNHLHTSNSSITDHTLISPLPLAANSLITRKNLLSLTKRRRSKRNSFTGTNEEIAAVNDEVCALNVITTPIKTAVLNTIEQTPETPNLHEFIASAPLTSTPEINKPSKVPLSLVDSDLKPIIWKNTSASNLHTTKLSDNSSLNITLNSSNPTVKERIGRLEIYGQASPLSPILIENHHSCRPSGLRRTRSMTKKT